MKKIFGYTGSLILIVVISISAPAQKKAFVPSGIQIGADVALAGASLISKDYDVFEFNADIDIYKFYLSIDYGLGKYGFEEPEYRYTNSGNYMRFGIDYNFIFDDPDGHAIFFGINYALSNYSENFSYDIEDPIFGNYSTDITGSNLKSNWVEAVLGIKIRVWKELYMGWMGRLKFAKGSSSSNSTFNNYWIPGFGKGENESSWGFGYQILYRIPFREKPIIQRKNKEDKPA